MLNEQEESEWRFCVCMCICVCTCMRACVHARMRVCGFEWVWVWVGWRAVLLSSCLASVCFNVWSSICLMVSFLCVAFTQFWISFAYSHTQNREITLLRSAFLLISQTHKLKKIHICTQYGEITFWRSNQLQVVCSVSLSSTKFRRRLGKPRYHKTNFPPTFQGKRKRLKN